MEGRAGQVCESVMFTLPIFSPLGTQTVPQPSDLNRERRLEQPELLAVRSWPGQGKLETPRSEREERGEVVT